MSSEESLRIAARPLTLDEFRALQNIVQRKYYEESRKSRKPFRIWLFVSWILIFSVSLWLTSYELIFVPLSSIGEIFGELRIAGAWLIGLAFVFYVFGVLQQIASAQAVAAHVVKSEWSARLRMVWVETRLDRRGIAVEGPDAAIFQAWSTVTSIRSEAGLILIETDGAILLAIPEAAMSADEREKVLAYGRARIAENEGSSISGAIAISDDRRPRDRQEASSS